LIVNLAASTGFIFEGVFLIPFTSYQLAHSIELFTFSYVSMQLNCWNPFSSYQLAHSIEFYHCSYVSMLLDGWNDHHLQNM